MPSQLDIDQQHQLLETHRRTLARLLLDLAKYGGQHTPPSLLNSIDDTREQLRQVKQGLRRWGQVVEDHPNDGDAPPAPDAPPTPSETMALLTKQASLSLQAILTHGRFAHKYVHDVYVERQDAEELFQRFLRQSQQHCYVITGQAGKGKTFLLCRLAKSLDQSDRFVPVLISSTTLERLSLTEAILEQLGPALAATPYQPDFKDLAECLRAQNIPLVVFIDAINELEGDEDNNAFERFSENLNNLLKTVVANHYPILFCISCRSEFWIHFSSADWVGPHIFEPLGLMLPTYELKDFDEEQIESIKQRYFDWYALDGNLLISARKSCCDPIMWYYLCTAFSARKSSRESLEQIQRRSIGDIRTLRRKEVFDKFVDSKRQAMIEATQGLTEEWSDYELTTRYLITIAYEMYRQGRSYITADEVIRLAKKLKHYDDTLKNKPNMRSFLDNPASIFFKFIDEGVLIKRDKESYQFVFETYFEYAIGRYIALEHWRKLRKNKKLDQAAIKANFIALLQAHARLVERTNFTNLFGALQFAILVTEDHKWYHDYPTLFIELIECMRTFGGGGFNWIQQACATIRETALAHAGTWEKLQEPAAHEAAAQRFAGLLGILEDLTLKSDFVVLWDVENTLQVLAEAHFRLTLQRVRHWAIHGQGLQPIFATQTLTRLSTIRPRAVVDLLVELAELPRYRSDFWLARILIFATLGLAQRHWEEALSASDRAQLRMIVRSLAVAPAPVYTRGVALATLPFLSQAYESELQRVNEHIDAETWPWALWNLAYELHHWPEDWPHDWVWNTLDKLARTANPHVRYAVDHTAGQLAAHSPTRAALLRAALAGNRWCADPGPEPAIENPALIGIVYSPAYLAPSYDNHVECRERVQAILEKLIAVGSASFNWLNPYDNVEHLLHLAHNERTDRHRNGAPWPTYVQDVRRGYDLLAQRLDSPHVATGPSELRYESYEAALRSVGGVIRAIDYVLDGPARAAWSLGRPPGHLANNAICIFNNIAIAARYAQQQLKQRQRSQRILIVDCDAHHGLHTSHVFLNDPSVIYFSLHMDGDYAREEGQVEHIGKEAGAGYNFNLPYPPFMGDAGYAYLVDQLLLPVARAFQPELIMISAGFDGHFDDPLTPSCILTEHAYMHLAAGLRDLAEELEIKLVGVLEGGYGLEGLSNSFAHMVSIIGRWPVSPATIGFAPLNGYAEKADPAALASVKALVARRVALMAETKRRNPAYWFDMQQPHWQAILADQPEKR
jgi:acetoin utilization deacetylase AcuC-like enzyme